MTLECIARNTLHFSDRSKPLTEGNGLTARMIRFMTSLMYGNVRECVCDLLFALCNEDGESLVFLSKYDAWVLNVTTFSK